MDILEVAVAVALWAVLIARYCVKLPKGKVGAVLVIAPLFPLAGFVGALVKWGSVPLAAGLISVAAVVPWLATDFKPELMLNPEVVYDDDEITDEIRKRANRYQLRAVIIIVTLVLVAAVIFWDRIPEV